MGVVVFGAHVRKEWVDEDAREVDGDGQGDGDGEKGSALSVKGVDAGWPGEGGERGEEDKESGTEPDTAAPE